MNLLISLSTLATKAARVLDPKNYTYRKQMTIFHTPSFPAYGKVQNCSLPQWCSSQNQSSPVWIFMALGCLLKGCCSCISNPKSQTVPKDISCAFDCKRHSFRSFILIMNLSNHGSGLWKRPRNQTAHLDSWSILVKNYLSSEISYKLFSPKVTPTGWENMICSFFGGSFLYSSSTHSIFSRKIWKLHNDVKFLYIYCMISF